MLDHVSLGVADFDRSQAFYDRVLASLGMARCFNFPGAAGYGADGRAVFWIGKPDDVRSPQPSTGTHLAFSAKNRPSVDAFHAAALAAGGRDNGAPGLRPHYHPNYYGAFAVDPDGHKIEACCHLPA
jgi:catechol 2,3-dioxygenase-like lactoylglutathione lyase family enzyme